MVVLGVRDLALAKDDVLNEPVIFLDGVKLRQVM
jgi:hypothetical protein